MTASAQLFFRSYRDVPTDAWRWPSFVPAEIACRGTGALLIVPEALDRLQRLRDILGRPVALNSAFRSPAHNAAVGGADLSKHLFGVAFDIPHRDEAHREAVIAAAREAGFTGFGRYASFTHIDLGKPREF